MSEATDRADHNPAQRILYSDRFPVLDGLRGTAAFLVATFHFYQIVTPKLEDTPFAHAYLAVDFFFCLSGYVIGHAYDRRYKTLTVAQFLRARLMRLHPLLIVGTLLGLASYMLDPFAGSARATVSGGRLSEALFAGLLSLPSHTLPDRWGAYFPLNSPAWSLMWEYTASIVFAVILWRLRNFWLAVATAIAAIILVYVALHRGHLSTGFSWQTMPDGAVRTAFSFGIGLFLFRTGAAIRSRLGWGTLSLILAGIFSWPYRAGDTWLFDLAVVTMAFPAIVALGAGATIREPYSKAADAAGELSYPLYICHYALVTLWLSYCQSEGPGAVTFAVAVPCLLLVSVMVAGALSYGYDRPVRRFLSQISARPRVAGSARGRGKLRDGPMLDPEVRQAVRP